MFGHHLCPDFKYSVNDNGNWRPAFCLSAEDDNNGTFVYLNTDDDTLHTMKASRGTEAGQFKSV